MPSQMACEVRDFDPAAAGLNEYEIGTLDRHVQFALASSIQAMEDAELGASAVDGERAGVFIGSTNSAEAAAKSSSVCQPPAPLRVATIFSANSPS